MAEKMVFKIGKTSCRRCKDEFEYNVMGIKPEYCCLGCEQIDRDYQEERNMTLKDEVIDKAAEQSAMVVGHAFDAGYADGMESRQTEIDELLADNKKMKHNLVVLKEALEKVLVEV